MLLTNCSVGAAMTDALDHFISERRIEPQIAIKMLQHFDRVVAEVLNEKVKARMSFKVEFSFSTDTANARSYCLIGPPRHLSIL